MSRNTGYTFGADPYKSIVFYGMFVDSTSLFWAAEAWRSLEKPLIGIDIILSRLKHSTLRTHLDKFDLTRIPVSVWTAIKQELIDIEIGEAEKRECNFLWKCAVDSGQVRATDQKWNNWDMVLGDQRGWMYVMLDRGGVYEIERRYLPVSCFHYLSSRRNKRQMIRIDKKLTLLHIHRRSATSWSRTVSSHRILVRPSSTKPVT